MGTVSSCYALLFVVHAGTVMLAMRANKFGDRVQLRRLAVLLALFTAAWGGSAITWCGAALAGWLWRAPLHAVLCRDRFRGTLRVASVRSRAESDGRNGRCVRTGLSAAQTR